MKRRLRQWLFGIAAVALCAFALLYLFSIPSYPVRFGASFSPAYAAELGVDWRTAYAAMLAELKPPIIRIAAQWDEIEPVRGERHFADLDWMMDKAAESGARVLLTVGQKTPRWPECHFPAWYDGAAPDAREVFFSFADAVIARYRSHPALELWQVENEPFIRFRFGECAQFHEEWVDAEVARVRAADPAHRIVITDSGELGLWRKAVRTGDVLGTTMYRIVRRPSGAIWAYDWLPPAWYLLRARLWGEGYDRFFISELQAEPWFAGSIPAQTPVAEQELTMSPARLKNHLDYAQHTGASRAYLWGVEWWYWMKTARGDARYWDIAKSAFRD
jgi:hypothetical protein